MSSAAAGQSQSEVTCSDYLQYLNEENNKQGSINTASQNNNVASSSSNHNGSVETFYNIDGVQKDSYMWKVIQKRTRTSLMFNLVSGQ